jgi:hypothetical protein
MITTVLRLASSFTFLFPKALKLQIEVEKREKIDPKPPTPPAPFSEWLIRSFQ